MKGQIIEVQIHNNEPKTLYMCFGVDCEDICYFICLENEYSVNKYISMTKDQLKDRKNKKDHYSLVYTPLTEGEELEMLSSIRQGDFKK
jgi:hypothetical protein